jgi:hypothetical protein
MRKASSMLAFSLWLVDAVFVKCGTAENYCRLEPSC